ncbi:MAG: signal peptidase I [Candidatus Saccharibacteria bacterium]
MHDDQTTQQQTTEPVIPEPKKQGDTIRSIASTVAILLLAPLIAIFLTAFVFQSYQVDGQSMETTLQNNDRLIVWKMARTWSRITGHAYIPARGDIIIFNEPQDKLEGFEQTGTKQLIKRVVGLPGDHVVVKNGVLTIYNAQHPNGFQPDKTLPYGKNIPETNIDTDLVVPKNNVFVCGDNRPDSQDSRMFGPISADQIVGKLVMRVLPANSAERF